jgi:hypothetical protein
MFFGQDLLRIPPETGRALLNHSRDIGLLVRDRLAVLGLLQTEEFYAGDPKKAGMRPVANPTGADRELERDAIALFEVADDLYTRRRYRIDGENAGDTARPMALARTFHAAPAGPRP